MLVQIFTTSERTRRFKRLSRMYVACSGDNLSESRRRYRPLHPSIPKTDSVGRSRLIKQLSQFKVDASGGDPGGFAGQNERGGHWFDFFAGRNRGPYTERVNSSVSRFGQKCVHKFLRPMGHTTAAVQPSKKKIARGTFTKTLWQTF